MTDATPFVVFVVAVIGMFVCLLANVRIPVPTAISSNGRLRIDYIIPPLIGVIVLLISGSMTFEEVWRGGVVGDKDIRPYVIIILFNALAYICVSLDATGCLTFISLKVAQAAGSSRKRLFVYFFTLASVMTSVTSNDIVIMTLTPVVLQCAKFTGTKPWAYLFAQFFAANSCSYILVIGNPTNIIVADAFKISFAEFSKTMIVPVLITTVVGGVIIYFLFREDLQGSFTPPDLRPREQLIDVRGAKVHAAILGACVLFMSVSSLIPDVELWMVSLGGFVLSLAYNIYAYKWTSPEAEARAAALARLEAHASEDKAVSASTSKHIQTLNPEDDLLSGQQRQELARGAVRPDQPLTGSGYVDSSDTYVEHDGPEVVYQVGGTRGVRSDSGISLDSVYAIETGNAGAVPTAGAGACAGAGITSPKSRHTVNFLIDDDSNGHNINSINNGGNGIISVGATATPATHATGVDINANGVVVDDDVLSATAAARSARTLSRSSTPSIEGDATMAAKPIMPTVKALLFALPWKLLPFVFTMFVLVEGLKISGWIEEIAEAFVNMMNPDKVNASSSPQVVPALFMMFVTLVFCNLINNQPATLLITRMLISKPFERLSRPAIVGAAYAVVAGSNLAASLTIVGALAGIMFAQLLKLHGKPTTYLGFLKSGVAVTPIIALLAALLISMMLM